MQRPASRPDPGPEETAPVTSTFFPLRFRSIERFLESSCGTSPTTRKRDRGSDPPRPRASVCLRRASRSSFARMEVRWACKRKFPVSAVAYTSRDLGPYRPASCCEKVCRGQGRSEGDDRAAPGTASGWRDAWAWYRRRGSGPASESVERGLAMSRVMRTAAAVDYPCSDGRPMAESEAQLRAMLYVVWVLYTHFRDRSDVYVGADMFIYCEEGNPGAVVAPDVFVAIGAPKRAQDPRLSYKLWEEPKGPDFVLEVVSRSTWPVDRDRKRALYASLGVEEYWLYDPPGERLERRLRGMRLVGGRYRELPPAASSEVGIRHLRSAVLGLDMWVDQDDVLQVRDPVTGEVFLRPDEERVKRLAAETRARREAAAREAAEARAGEEAAAREAAEAQVAELQARLRELQGVR